MQLHEWMEALLMTAEVQKAVCMRPVHSVWVYTQVCSQGSEKHGFAVLKQTPQTRPADYCHRLEQQACAICSAKLASRSAHMSVMML